jgi:SIR2-like protein
VGSPTVGPQELSGDDPALRDHCRMVALALADGEVVPFLGAGVNLCGRPQGEAWKPGVSLPSGRELSEYLARRSGYPLADADNLVRVAQYQATMQGGGPLYKRLREIFDADYPPTELHRFLAELPATLEHEFGKRRHQLIVTTNYDDALERAFVAAEQPFDLFTYVAFGEDAGKFLHVSPDAEPHLVANPRRFTDPILEQRPAILKIHGAVDRLDAARDSFVITEDHYIEFLQRTEITKLVPLSLLPALQASHFLFLGYSLRDWNLRVILQRIWEEQEHGWSSWAVQHETNPLDQKFWMQRGVDIQVVDLHAYVEALAAMLPVVAHEVAGP